MHADYHVHTNYSDGSFLEWMVTAAEQAGLTAIGLADHCVCTERPRPSAHRAVAGYNLDLTYQRRRSAIETIQSEVDITIYDGVEMDYFPDEEPAIESFLAEVGFDYTIGAIHEVDGTNVHFDSAFTQHSRDEREAVVEDYFDDLERLIRSELFDIAAHPDIVERNEALRGLATESHYHRIASALQESRTVPELNAGRIDTDYGRFHPRERFVEVLRSYDVRFTVGSDAHQPAHLDERIPQLASAFDAYELQPLDPL